MQKKKSVWCNPLFVSGLALIPLLMVTVDGPLSATMEPFGAAAQSFVGVLSMTGDSKYALGATGVTSAALLVLYLVDGSTEQARLWAWLAAASGFILLSVAFSGLLVDVIKILIGRARPGVAAVLNWPEFHPFTIIGTYFSFPSGHSNTEFSLALAVGFLVPPLRRWLLALASVFAFCRVLQFRHFVSDVVGGALLAVATTYWLRDKFARLGVLFVAGREGRMTFTAPGRLLVRRLKRSVGRRKRPRGAATKRQPMGKVS